MSNFNGATWMQDNLSLLGDKKLIDICITGSHDSGMSIVQHGTAGSNACNTKTQTNSIGGQLGLGARYFDIRPVIGSGKYYTGHYTKIDKEFLGIKISTEQGSRGQSISDIISEVNDFTAANNELVILNLSHDMDTDASNSDYPSFNQSQWNGLFAELATLNNLFVTEGTANLTEYTLNQFIGAGKAAVLVIVEPGGVSLGDYASQGFYPYSSFNVYNSYADTSDFKKMAADQWGKMETEKPKGAYFLLSWTLTQDTSQVLACVVSGDSATTILQAADSANAQLAPQAEQHTTTSLYPNILYIDNITNSDFAQTAMAINTKAFS